MTIFKRLWSWIKNNPLAFLLSLVMLCALTVITLMFKYALDNNLAYKPISEFTTILIIAIAAIATSLTGLIIEGQLKQQTQDYINRNTPAIESKLNDNHETLYNSIPIKCLHGDKCSVEKHDNISIRHTFKNVSPLTGEARISIYAFVLDEGASDDGSPKAKCYNLSCMRAHRGFNLNNIISLFPGRQISGNYSLPHHFKLASSKNGPVPEVDYRLIDNLINTILNSGGWNEEYKCFRVYFSFIAFVKPLKIEKYSYRLEDTYYVQHADGSINGETKKMLIYRKNIVTPDGIQQALPKLVNGQITAVKVPANIKIWPKGIPDD